MREFTFVALLVILLSCTTSYAAEISYNTEVPCPRPVGCNWGNPAIWVGGVVPSSGDTVTIASPSSSNRNNTLIQWASGEANVDTLILDNVVVIGNGYVRPKRIIMNSTEFILPGRMQIMIMFAATDSCDITLYGDILAQEVQSNATIHLYNSSQFEGVYSTWGGEIYSYNDSSLYGEVVTITGNIFVNSSKLPYFKDSVHFQSGYSHFLNGLLIESSTNITISTTDVHVYSAVHINGTLTFDGENGELHIADVPHEFYNVIAGPIHTTSGKGKILLRKSSVDLGSPDVKNSNRFFDYSNITIVLLNDATANVKNIRLGEVIGYPHGNVLRIEDDVNLTKNVSLSGGYIYVAPAAELTSKNDVSVIASQVLYDGAMRVVPWQTLNFVGNLTFTGNAVMYVDISGAKEEVPMVQAIGNVFIPAESITLNVVTEKNAPTIETVYELLRSTNPITGQITKRGDVTTGSVSIKASSNSIYFTFVPTPPKKSKAWIIAVVVVGVVVVVGAFGFFAWKKLFQKKPRRDYEPINNL